MVRVQAFVSLDIATQALIATHLGKVSNWLLAGHPSARQAGGQVSGSTCRLLSPARVSCSLDAEPHATSKRSRVAPLITVLCSQDDMETAKEVMFRVIQLGLMIGGTLGLGVLLFRANAAMLFTKDNAVRLLTAAHLPIIALYLVRPPGWPPCHGSCTQRCPCPCTS